MSIELQYLSSIQMQRDASDVSGRVRRQESNSIGHILRLHVATEGVGRRHSFNYFRFRFVRQSHMFQDVRRHRSWTKMAIVTRAEQVCHTTHLISLTRTPFRPRSAAKDRVIDEIAPLDIAYGSI